MAKKVSIFCFLFILFLSGKALAASFIWAGVFSEHRSYAPADGSTDYVGDGVNLLVASAWVSDYAYQEGDYMQVKWDDKIVPLLYLGDRFVGNDLFAETLATDSPYPEYTGKTYLFELKDKDDNTIASSSWIVPETPYPFTELDIPVVTMVDSRKDYFEWEQVPTAEYYQFAVAPLGVLGQALLAETIFLSEKLYETNFTVPNVIPPGSYALWIWAIKNNPEGN